MSLLLFFYTRYFMPTYMGGVKGLTLCMFVAFLSAFYFLFSHLTGRESILGYLTIPTPTKMIIIIRHASQASLPPLSGSLQ